MKKIVFYALMGIVCGVAYYLFGANYMYEKLPISLFAQENAWVISVFVFCGFMFAYLRNSLHDRDNRTLSSDKIKALYHEPPKKYLSSKPDGLTVGTHGRKYVRIPFLNSPEHQLIIGAPGDFKSMTIENAIIYDMNFATPEEKLCSMLVVDIKPELQRLGIRPGEAITINPSVPYSTGFDITYGLTLKSSDDDLYDRFSMIANTIIKDTGSDNLYFAEAARNIFTSFLMYGFIIGRTFGESIDIILEAPVDDLIAQIVTDNRMSNHKRVTRLIKEFDGKTSDGFQDVAMTLKKDLAIFDNTSVKACFSSSNQNRVSPVDLVNGKSIFLAIPDHLFKSYAPVFRLIINTCMTYIMSCDETQRENKRPIWVLIDEAGSIGKLPILEDVLARGRSKGIQCSLVIQSDAQLDEHYGRDMARTIKDCCKTTIVFGSNNDQMCEALSKRTGVFSESKISTTTRGSSLSEGSSRSESTEYRPAVDVADIQNLSDKNKVLVFAKGTWFIVDKAPYFKIKQFNDKSKEIEKQYKELRLKSS